MDKFRGGIENKEIPHVINMRSLKVYLPATARFTARSGFVRTRSLHATVKFWDGSNVNASTAMSAAFLVGY